MSLFLFIWFFIAAVFLAFYIPGRVLLGEQKNLSKIGLFAVSIILGIVLWGWQGYLFGFLQMRWLSYVYLLVFLAIFLKRKYVSFEIPKIKLKNIDWLTFSLVFVGILGQTLQFIRNGQLTSAGLFLSNYNFIDHEWHVTLVSELVKRFPPFEPGMYGVLLTNYHFWFNLVTADLVRVFNLPLFQTQFIGMYVLAPILLSLIAYSFISSVYNSKLLLRLFLFFLYFSGDAAGWFMLIVRQRFDLNLGWMFENETNFIDSPGRGFAVIITLAAIYLLFKNRQQISKKNIFIIGILFGSLMGFKVYFAIPFMLGLFCLALFDALRRNFSSVWIFIIASVVFLIQFLPFNSSSGGLFFLPFNIPREFFAQPGLHMSYLDQRWSIYFDHHNYLRLIQYGVLMSIVYFLVQFGVKLIGLIPFRKTVKTLTPGMYFFLYSTMIFSFILGLFFYQKVGGANIWEFFLIMSFVLAIFVSLNVTLFLEKRNKAVVAILIFLLVILVIPRWIYSVTDRIYGDYLSGFHGISNQQYQAYNYLRNKTNKDSLVFLIDRRKIVSYSSLASVLTDRNQFFSGNGVGQVMTPEILRRENDSVVIKTSINAKMVRDVLKRDKIDYIYLDNSIVLPVATVSSFLEKMFFNESGTIFKVN